MMKLATLGIDRKSSLRGDSFPGITDVQQVFEVLRVAMLLVLFLNGGLAGAWASEDRGSVGIVSSVNGEARISHSAGTQEWNQPRFRGPIIYGDHLSTGRDATLGLLVGQNSLLTLRELTEVRIAESVKNRQVLEISKGKVCLASSRPDGTEPQPLVLRTPTAVITAGAGTLLSIEVENAPSQGSLREGEKNRGGRTFLPVVMPVAEEETAPVIETYHVVEGSVDIVSLAPGPSSLSLHSGQSLRVLGGVRGKPFVSPPVNCRVQETQLVPYHTNTPVSAQRMIVRQQMEIVGKEGVAASAPLSTAAPSAGLIPAGIYLPTTGVLPTVPTRIRVILP